jgi:hypothetical protein
MSASERKAFVEGAEWACGDRAHPQADREANDLYPDSPCKNIKQIVSEVCCAWSKNSIGWYSRSCENGQSFPMPDDGICTSCHRRIKIVAGKIVGREPKSHHEKRTDEDIKEEDDRKMNLDGNDFGDS